MKSLRKRMDLELVTNPTRAKKFIARPTTLHWNIITENLVSIKKPETKNNRRPTDLSGLLYFGYVKNNNVQIPLRGNFEQVRIACYIGLHRYTTSKHPNCTKTWRTTWTRMTLPTIRSTTPPLEDERQGLRQDEGRMLEYGTSRIWWASCQNLQHPPPQR